MGLEEEGKVPFSSDMSRIHTITMTYHCGGNLDPLHEIVFVRFLSCKVIHSPFYIVLKKLLCPDSVIFHLVEDRVST